jgi:hypothetical protein
MESAIKSIDYGVTGPNEEKYTLENPFLFSQLQL